MKLNFLETHPDEFFQLLKEAGYADSSISKIKSCFNQLMKFKKAGKITSFDEMAQYCKESYSYEWALIKCRYLRFMQFYDENGEIPERGYVHFKENPSARQRINQEFQQMCDFYEDFKLKEGKQKSKTIRDTIYTFSNFLEYVQKLGYDDLSEISEKEVLDYFLDLEGTARFSYTTGRNIKKALEVCQEIREQECKRLIPFIPVAKKCRKNIQYLEDWEIEIIKEVLNSDELSFRDKAVMTILLYTGLRGCDIVNLTMSAIDLDNDVMNIIQEKTDVPLQLPLLVSIGNALVDYVSNERPQPFLQEDEDIIFLSQKAPHQRLNGIRHIVNSFLNVCELRIEKGDRRGTHIFRHHLVASLLYKDVPLPQISTIIGHSDPASLQPYYNTNFEELRKLCLSIEPYEFDRSRYHE